jgi:hypothetical protein
MKWYSDSGASTADTTATVFDKRYAKFVFNKKDISAIYIDWGDGEGREVSNANYQWTTFPSVVQTSIVPHTYTASGNYDVIVQTINQKGFASKYYCDDITVSGSVSPFEASSRIEQIVVSDGEATGIIKCENRTVKSGIDNTIFVAEGPRQVYVQIPPILNSTEYGYIGTIKLRITAVLVDSIRDSSDNEAVVAGGSRRVKKFDVELSSVASKTDPVNVLDGATTEIDGAAIAQILRVEYRNPKITGSYASDYTRNEVFNRLKIFLTAKAIDGYYYPLVYVTAGTPTKSVDNLYRYITMDFSQSRAKASNVANSKYRYDNGKTFFRPAGDYQWNITGTNYFNNNTRQTSDTRRVDYTYMPRPIGLRGSATYDSTGTEAFGDEDWVSGSDTGYVTDQFALDDFGRFYDQYHLIRNSMQPSSSADATGSTVSSLIANKPYVFRITPPVNWTGATEDKYSATKIDAAGMGTAQGNFTADYTSEAFNNGSSNEIGFTEMNGASFLDVAGDARVANEYFLLLFPSKTSRVFFNMTNYANGLMSDWANATGITIAGVYYLGVSQSGTINQTAEWKAIEFEDTTSISKTYPNTTDSDPLSGSYVTKELSFAKSGYVSFDTPDDWQSISLDNLCGGYFDSTDQTATGSLGIKVTGGTVDTYANPDSIFGGVLEVTGTSTDEIKDQMEAVFTSANEVGAFNYIAFPSGTSGMPLWVGSGASNGWDGEDTLYFNYGENNDPNYNVQGLTGEHSWILRRVNVYDVIDGPSKVYKGDTSTPPRLNPVDAPDGTITWTGRYIISNVSSGVGEAIKDAWETTDLYALKIVLSGTTGKLANPTLSATVPRPEMWNVFDATEGHVTVVKEIDDSAYTLNSLSITSDMSMSRAGNYYTAISRKGKVFISRTGTPIQELSFSSVALGDDSATTAFSTSSAGDSLYGHLHKVRELQSNDVRVYWDEKQKDGTYVRLWGIIKSVDETLGTGGSRAVLSYSFNITIEEIALLDIDGDFMTEVFPIGGVLDARTYT